MNNILVFGVNWFGDALMSTPFFKNIKESIEGAKITLVTHERVKDLFLGSPYVDDFIYVDKKISIIRALFLVKYIRRVNPDTVFLLRPSTTQLLACYLAGVKKVICHTKNGKKIFGTYSVAMPEDSHRMDVYLSLLEAQGIPIKTRTMQVFVGENETEVAKGIVRDLKQADNPLIVIHPMANWDLKRWPLKKFSRLADKLIDKLGAVIVFTGTKEDSCLVNEIKQTMKNNAHDLTGKMNIRELAAFLKQVDLFVSADTGIMHLSAAVGAPLLALFGPTGKKLTGPRGDGVMRLVSSDKNDCILPCYKLDCSDNFCMSSIDVDSVLAQIEELLNNGK